MARTIFRMNCHLRWWVRPFLFLAYVAVVPFASVVDLELYIARVAAIAARHGLKITVG